MVNGTQLDSEMPEKAIRNKCNGFSFSFIIISSLNCFTFFPERIGSKPIILDHYTIGLAFYKT